MLGWSVLILVGVLGLLWIWQRRLESHAADQVRKNLEDARERGVDRAIAQHPLIETQRCIGCASCITACPESGVIELVNGVAQVVYGSRCIGHAKCAEACPVGALHVGLGTIAGRADLPILDEWQQTTVPGLFVAGELGGIALVRNAIEQGTRAVTQIARQATRAREQLRADSLDLLIVGAGPAGLAASLKAHECGLSYLTIDEQDLGGTVRKYPRHKLTMTQPVDLPVAGRMERREYLKEELIELWEDIATRFDLRLGLGTKLTAVQRVDGGFLSSTTQGEIRSRFVVLALGRRGIPRRLGVPGEELDHVFYQLVDAAHYHHQRLLVVGGGDSAIEAATALANQPGNQVMLSYRKAHFFRIKQRNEERLQEYAREGRIRLALSSEVQRFERGAVELTLSGEDHPRVERLENDHAFIFAGGEPPYPLLKHAGVLFGDSIRLDSSEPSTSTAGAT
ncbi:MAG: NAD(P)-binding domain-containing protein [Planctomycetota bacterium]